MTSIQDQNKDYSQSNLNNSTDAEEKSQTNLLSIMNQKIYKFTANNSRCIQQVINLMLHLAIVIIIFLSLAIYKQLTSASTVQSLISSQMQIQNHNDFTVVIYSGQEELNFLPDTLHSFFSYNNFPLKKIIVAIETTNKKNRQHIMSQFKNVTWISSQREIGEIALVDKALARVDSQFYLLCKAGYVFIRPNFIQEGLALMSFDSALSGVVLRAEDYKQIYNCTLIDSIECGFSIEPTIFRLSDYQRIGGGYTNASSSNNKFSQNKVSIGYEYFQMKKHLYYLQEPFTQNLNKKQNPNLHNVTTNNNSLVKEYKLINLNYQLKKNLTDMLNNGIKVNQQLLKIIFKNQKTYSKYGILQNIQSVSVFDYLRLNETEFFKAFKNYFEKIYVEFDYEIFQLQQRRKINQINKTKIYLSEQEIKYEVASNTLNNQKNQSIQIFDYYYFSEKINAERKLKRETEMCVVVHGTKNQYDHPRFDKFLQSLKNQHYNEISLVLIASGKVDINSIKKKVQVLPVFLKNGLVQIVGDHKQLGSIGIFGQLKKFCSKNSIIINLRPTDQIITHRFFDIISSAYQIPNLKFATFRSIQIAQNNSIIYQQLENLDKNLINNFRKLNERDLAPFVKTYRHQLTRRSIVQHLTQFQFVNQSSNIFPRFYKTASDTIQTYALVQLAGLNHTMFFDEVIISRKPRKYQNKCQKEKQAFNQIKAQFKYSLKQLKSPLKPTQILQDPFISQKLLKRLQKAHFAHNKCLYG